MKKLLLLYSVLLLLYKPVLSAQCWDVAYHLPGSNVLFDIFFLNDSIGWVSGDQTIMNTTDRGVHWQNIEIDNFTWVSPKCIFFINDQFGWMAHSVSVLFKTHNGGETWAHFSIPNASSGNTIQDLYFVNENTGWVVIGNGNIYRTDNGGEDWILQFLSEGLYFFSKITFIDENMGWVCGSKRYGNYQAIIYYTENGGETWIEQFESIDPSWSFYDIQVLDENKGWVAGRNSKVFATENGGNIWLPISNSFDTTYLYFNTHAIHFVNDTLGWMGSTYGIGPGALSDTVLCVTTNGGINWNRYKTDTINRVSEIQMLNPDYGWAVTYDGKILRYQGGPAACGSALLWPPDGAGGIPLQPTLSWSRSPGCVDGYLLRIGSSPGLDDLLPAVDVGYDTVYTLPVALPAATQSYVSIQPYNHVYGAGETCQSYSFTTAVCPEPLQIDTFFCSGTPLAWADTTWETPGDYELVYALPSGCDSIVQLHLEEEPTYFTEVDTTLAAGAVFEGIPHYADTSFVLLYSAANGCDSLVKVQIRVVVGQREPANATRAIKVYPNPVQIDELIVEMSSPAIQTGTAQLYSAQGVSVRRWAYSALAGRFTLDVSGLPPGVYGLEVHPGLPVVRVVIVR